MINSLMFIQWADCSGVSGNAKDFCNLLCFGAKAILILNLEISRRCTLMENNV